MHVPSGLEPAPLASPRRSRDQQQIYAAAYPDVAAWAGRPGKQYSHGQGQGDHLDSRGSLNRLVVIGQELCKFTAHGSRRLRMAAPAVGASLELLNGTPVQAMGGAQHTWDLHMWPCSTLDTPALSVSSFSCSSMTGYRDALPTTAFQHARSSNTSESLSLGGSAVAHVVLQEGTSARS